MIFVTVGNATQAFPRLLESVDSLAARGLLGDTVLMQTGNFPGFQPLHCAAIGFLPPDEFKRRIREAQVIISHAGAGTLFHAFEIGKIPVVMPRRAKYREHVEDQLELVKVLAAAGRVIPAYEPNDLPAAIDEARKRGTQPLPAAPVRMIELVSQAIGELLVDHR